MTGSTKFARLVERICSEHDLTQREVAEGIGVTPETITRWKASFSPPSSELIRAWTFLRRFDGALEISDLLDVSEAAAEGR